MSKKIQTTDTNIEVITSTALIVKVGAFKFIKEEDYPWADIYLTGGEVDEFIEQIELDEVITIDDLKLKAINWVFDNVEIVKTVTKD